VPSVEDSILVSLLKSAGAIPFCRSNVPQCLMLPESDNAIWGTSANPWHRGRTPGGSSGGEAALVAARASPLGIGTDIGGSIRIPAHCCGVYGFKPTPARISSRGIAVPRPGGVSGQIAVKSVAGPIARCVSDIALVMRAWLGGEGGSGGDSNGGACMSSLDCNVPALGWDQDSCTVVEGKPMKFGIMRCDSFFHPAPPCKYWT
jgi:Asp-tRNA(Asn)/Glu-tRNA(Gln) amidotransferase A subunit family amidase